MYSEKTFKNYIFWIQVKRVVLIILLSCIGAAIGVLVSELLESLIKSNQYNVIIIVVSTVIMFFLSLLLTTGTGKEVQDGYWKIAVLRKLTTIQKLIETNNALLGNNGDLNGVVNKEQMNSLMMVVSGKDKKEAQSENGNDLEYEDDLESDEKQVEKTDEDKNKSNEKDKRTIKLNKKHKKSKNKKSNSEKVKEKV